MLGHLASILVRFDQLILFHVHEYSAPTTYALALPVIQMKIFYLTVILCIQHVLVYCSSVLTFIVIHFQNELGYMDLRKEQYIHTC